MEERGFPADALPQESEAVATGPSPPALPGAVEEEKRKAKEQRWYFP